MSVSGDGSVVEVPVGPGRDGATTPGSAHRIRDPSFDANAVSIDPRSTTWFVTPGTSI